MQWNVYGLDQVGHINADNSKYFYLKDHLGSIRAVLDTTNSVVSAQDYDAWGYIMQNRSWQSENARYKFTGKERDKDLENNYDYFGARYYDSRIANWSSVDPSFEQHYDFSPYNYVLRNPLRYIDPDGRQLQIIGGLQVALAIAATASAMYSAYQLYNIYESYTSTTYELAPELGHQEQLESQQQENITIQTLETRGKIKKGKIEGAIVQISKHLDKLEGRNPEFPNPNDQDKSDWKKQIEKHINNIKKEAQKLRKDYKNVIKELVQKGRLDEGKIRQAYEELTKHGINF